MANTKRFQVKHGLRTKDIEFTDNSGASNEIIASFIDATDTLSFSGNSGQLFAITDSITGSIFTVNDISGMPSIEVKDTGDIILAETAGNVGIGTNNPQTKLHIEATATTNLAALRLHNLHGDASNQGSVDIDFDVIASTSQIARARIRGSESTTDAPYSELSFWTSNTTSTEPTQRMVIDKDGNVGINETAPTYPLQVTTAATGKWRLNEYGGMHFHNLTDANNERYIHGRSDGALSIGYVPIANLQVGGTAGEAYDQVHITSDGFVGVGVIPENWDPAFDVLRIGRTTSLFSYDTAGDGTWLGSNAWYSDTSNDYRYITSDPAELYAQINGTHIWSQAAAGTAGETTSVISGLRYEITSAPTPSLIPVGAANDNVGTTFTATGNETLTGGGVTQLIDFVEHMRLNDSGDLLVGQTTGTIWNQSSVTGVTVGGNGSIQATASAGTVLFLNRLSGPGQITGFYKDGLQVGAIGTAGDDLTIGTGDTGLTFEDAASVIHPVNQATGDARDAAIDLGKSAARWKDLHLSGTTYSSGLFLEKSVTDTTQQDMLTISTVRGDFGSGGSSILFFDTETDPATTGGNASSRGRIKAYTENADEFQTDFIFSLSDRSDSTITSISASATEITVVHAASEGLGVEVGDLVIIQSTINFNGDFVVSNVDSNTQFRISTTAYDGVATENSGNVAKGETFDRMVIRGDGNVGIGTNAPTVKLDVNGIIQTYDGRVEGIVYPYNEQLSLPVSTAGAWYKIWSNSASPDGAPKLLKFFIVAAGDNTSWRGEFLVNIAGYNFQHSIELLDYQYYNQTKLEAIKTVNPGGTTGLEVWIQLGDITTSIGTLSVSCDNNQIQTLTATTEPTDTIGTSKLTKTSWPSDSARTSKALSHGLMIARTNDIQYNQTAPIGDLILSRKNTGNNTDQTVGIRFEVTGWEGSTTGAAAIEAIQDGGDSSSADLAFITRNAGTYSEKVRIQHDGKVGIGTSSPQNVLDIGQASSGRAITWEGYNNVWSEYSGGSLHLASNYYGNVSANDYLTAYTATYGAAGIRISGTEGSNNGGEISFYVDPETAKTAGAAFTPTERMVITKDGNVGIGTQNPQGILHSEWNNNAASGNVYFRNTNSGSSAYGGIYFGNDIALTEGFIGVLSSTNSTYAGARSMVLGTNSSAGIAFMTGGTEKARIDSSGNVGIGTSSPTNKFEVAGTQGQLFSVADSFTGTIFSVNDGSGVPSVEVMDTGDIYLAEFGGNVGIGTSAPGEALEIYRAANDAGILLARNDVSQTLRIDQNSIRTITNSKLSLGTNGNTHVYIGTTGNVGIGTDAPEQKLHIIDTSNPGATTGSVIIEGQRDGAANVLELRARDASAPTVALPNDQGPVMRFTGFDGADFEEMAWIYAQSGAAIADGDAPSSLVFGTTSDNAGAASRKMTITSAGNVGIGAIGSGNIDQILHVEKTSGTTLVKTEVASNSIVGFEIAKTNATTQSWRIVDGQTVNGVLEFHDLTNNATRMAIDGTGDVGIGTTTPTRKLDVNGYATATGFIAKNTAGVTDGASQFISRANVDNNTWMVGVAPAADVQGSVDNVTWGLFWAGDGTTGSNPPAFGTSGTHASNNGPGNIWGNATNQNEFVFVGSNQSAWIVQGSSGHTWQRGDLWVGGTYYRGGQEFLAIQDAAPTGVDGNLWWESDTGKLKIYYNDGNTSQWVDAVPIPDTSTLYSKAGGTITGAVNINSSLTTTGSAFIGGDVYANYSDSRLKNFTGTIESSLDKVKSLSGYLFTENEVAKQHGFDNDAQQVGVSAQEVQAVLPEAVALAPFDRDEETGASKSGENYLTVQYEKLVPLLIEAIKEQSATIEALTKRLEKLEG